MHKKLKIYLLFLLFVTYYYITLYHIYVIIECKSFSFIIKN